MGIRTKTKFSTSNKLLYVLYPDEKNLYDKVLDDKELLNITTEMLNSVSGIKVVGHKNKNKLNLWITKNRMLYDLPFISVEQYQKKIERLVYEESV